MRRFVFHVFGSLSILVAGAVTVGAGSACDYPLSLVPLQSDKPGGPEGACDDACGDRAGRCSSDQCAAGCNLVLDRLDEHEGEPVIQCVSAAPACDLPTWARCATLIGPHADGGPPLPSSAPPHP